MMVFVALAALVLLGLAPCAEGASWPSAVPFWPVYPTRMVQTLNGTWSFGYVDGEGVDPVSIPYSAISTPNTTTVPSVFDLAQPGVVGVRGTGFYRSTHACTPGLISLLKFYAVNFYARVFADGVDIGNHTAGGYTPFELVSPPCGGGGTRELLVIANNVPNATRDPTNTGGDFYFFSGIIRPVVVTELPAGAAQSYWIESVQPVSVDAKRGIIDVRVTFAGPGLALPNLTSVHLSLAFGGGAPSPAMEVPLVDGVALIGGVAVEGYAGPWGLGKANANLFTLTVSETGIGDALTVRSGVRVLGVDEATSRVTINGEVVKLLGFNRHTLWPDTGAAVTPAQEAADMALLQELNANYVRGAHYPQSQSWLDLCDEMGVAIWEEALGPGVSTADIQNAWFMANHLQAVTDMVVTSIAHPSVILSAFFNEGPSSDPNACAGYAASAAAIRAVANTGNNAPTRFVTWANDHTTSDVCIAFEDVISFNSYPGWYDQPLNLSEVPVFWGEMADWVATTWPTKPFFVSETGGGAIFEWLNDTIPAPGALWSQAYQARLLNADASFLSASARVSGLTLWQFCDIHADYSDTVSNGPCTYFPHPDNLTVPWNCSYINVPTGPGGRPGGENHKGVVDLWRRKKESFSVVQGIYAQYAT